LQDGYINLLINNAGISTPNLGPHTSRPTPKWEISKVRDYWFNKSFEDCAAVFETNTTAALMTTFAFLELLDQGNKVRAGQNASAQVNGAAKRNDYVRSQVVTLSSVGGFGRDNSAFVYGASKAGTTHMMKNLSTYLVPWKIRVNIIAPGCKFSLSIHRFSIVSTSSQLTNTLEDFNTEMMGNFYKSTGGRLPASLAPEERFGDIQEIGGTIVYLASKAGAYCNGLVMLVDGGYIANHPSTY
jgi:NAD(P)-dependent dehydrogenase (short-subunit alcohol dehydrogenase family)